MKDNKILPAYPGFTRRALTFTIDDANIACDKKFIGYVKKGGIRGTLNLCSRNMDMEDAYYRDLYHGYGIANHTSYHPFALDDATEYIYCDEPMGEQQPDPARLYPSPRGNGYYMKRFPHGWREMADDETYKKCVCECQAVLERIFGREMVTGFVWPYGEQNNAVVKQYLADMGFKSVRKTGDTLGNTNFDIPANRMAWSYNANNRNLLEVMKKYDATEDNGTLRFFAFGVHSWDFERDANWNDLETFTTLYGNRPNDYWYATVDEIFAYADAMDCLITTPTTLENPTDLTLYVELNGTKTTIPPHTKINI